MPNELQLTEKIRHRVLQKRMQKWNPHRALMVRRVSFVALVLAALIFALPIIYPQAALWVAQGKQAAILASFENPFRLSDVIYRSGAPGGEQIVVTAQKVWRDANDEDVIILYEPKVNFITASQDIIDVVGDQAFMNEETQIVRFEGNVVVTQGEGHEFSMAAIEIDIANQSAVSNTAVRGMGPLGVMRADGMKISEHGNKITMLKRTDMKLVKSAASGL